MAPTRISYNSVAKTYIMRNVPAIREEPFMGAAKGLFATGHIPAFTNRLWQGKYKECKIYLAKTCT